jgi:hypothetical protein
VVFDVADGGDSDTDEHRADDASSLVAGSSHGTAHGVKQANGATTSLQRCMPGSGFFINQFHCVSRTPPTRRRDDAHW